MKRGAVGGGDGERRNGRIEGDPGPSSPASRPEDERLLRLMEEFQARQRRRPELVVRPWWAAGPKSGRSGRMRGAAGFVVEYCPQGVESAELAVRRDRVRLEGPGGFREVSLSLKSGWLLEGEDRECPEIVANYLLRMADRLLDSEAA